MSLHRSERGGLFDTPYAAGEANRASATRSARESMFFILFHDHFPDLAERETRSILIPPDHPTNLPEGEYGFVELYCSDPDCDCRRVFFNVYSADQQRLEAVIAWGWESLRFYKAWMRSPDPSSVKDLKGPILNPGSPATELAPALLKLTRHVLLRDKAYCERIKRHYRMFKEKIAEPVVEKPKLLSGMEEYSLADRSFVQETVRSRRLRAFSSPDDRGDHMGDDLSPFTEKYLDVLQNLEFGIVRTYTQRPTMTDYDVMRILDALIDGYQAEKIGRAPRYLPATDVERELMDSVRGMCEWRLGRRPLSDDDRLKGKKMPDPLSSDEIVACLGKIRNSVRKWNKSGGRQGYLDFVIQHIG